MKGTIVIDSDGIELLIEITEMSNTKNLLVKTYKLISEDWIKRNPFE